MVIAKRLFDLDNNYEYLLSGTDTGGYNMVQIFKEDGSLLFSRDSCGLGQNFSQGEDLFPIKLTTGGTKMVLGTYTSQYEIYSLPGKLPGCSTSTLGVSNPSVTGSTPSLPTSAYPNPSSGRVRITYELPPGTSNGELILTTEDGREVKRYRVTNAFNDLLIEGSDLPNGSYFYKLVTEKGESQAKRIVQLK